MSSPNLIHVKITLPVRAAHALIYSVMGKPSGFCMRETHEAHGTETVEYWIIWTAERNPDRCTWRIAKASELSLGPV